MKTNIVARATELPQKDCMHEFWEVETAVTADGMCPLCLLDKLTASRERNAELIKALQDLVNAEEEYGDENNVAVNQAWSAAKTLLDRIHEKA